jgi:hypothetical protein
MLHAQPQGAAERCEDLQRENSRQARDYRPIALKNVMHITNLSQPIINEEMGPKNKKYYK